MAFEIYTDGSSLSRKAHKDYQKGGFACVFLKNGDIVGTFDAGVYPSKTGMVELLGVLIALKTLDNDDEAIVFCDSQYAINIFNKGWAISWEGRGWPDNIKNIEIIKVLLKEYRKFPKGNVEFKWVKGHSGNEFNNLADELADYRRHKIFYNYKYFL